MKPRITLATATSPDGTQLELVAHDRDFLILADGLPLMSTRLRHSEEELARVACENLPAGAEVLVGGLGLGFTLRAVLARLPADGRVVVAELVPEVVAWNRGPVAATLGDPFADPRVELALGDVASLIGRTKNRFAAIVLDIDNGPTRRPGALNQRLYSGAGLAEAAAALVSKGRLAIWSADDEVQDFVDRLARVGLRAQKITVPAHRGRGGKPHVVYLGERLAAAPRPPFPGRSSAP